MKRFLVIGLGNHTLPGTRHNAGLMALNFLNNRVLASQEFKIEKRLSAWVSARSLGKECLSKMGCDTSKLPSDFETQLLLFKTRDYMNFSGNAVKKILHETGFKAEDMLLVHDDLERKLGLISVKPKGSANGHNGVRSVIASVRTDQFTRFRLGIGKPEKQVGDYVLEKFTPEEVTILETLTFPKFNKALGDYIIINSLDTMIGA